MRERLGAFALSLHPDKTRLIECGRCAAANRERRSLRLATDEGEAQKIESLRFARAGKLLIHRKSRRDRLQAKLQEIKKAARQGMHQPIPAQGQWLGQVMRG